MKKSFTILICLLLSLFAKSQTSDTLSCDVPDRDSVEFENLPWVGNNDFLEQFLDSIGYPNSSQRIIGADQVKFHVPIKFWVYRSTSGVGGPDLRDLRNYIDNLNRIYNVVNRTWIGFYMRCDIGYINDDTHLNVGTDAEAWDLLQTYKERGCINIHIVNNVQDNFGISYRARLFGVDGIFLDRRTYTDPDLASTIAHEVGHYFELDHTHQYYNKGTCRQEPVDRNRTWPFFNLCFRKTVGAPMCEASGDGLRDTPADPELNDNVSCIFNNAGNYTNRTDNWGDHYASPPTGSTIPDTRNVLSYNGARACREVFSRLQIAVLLYSIYNGKSSGNRIAWGDAQGEYDEYEMDNFSQVARPITFNETQEHNFNREYHGDGVWGQCDIDWVRYVPACSGNFFVETSSMPGRSNADTRLTLFDAGLNQLAQNDNISGSNLFSLFSFNFVAGQEYFIRVENVGANRGTTYYRLQIHLNSISGPDVLCSPSAYTIPNLPQGATLNWSVSPQGIVNLSCTSCTSTTLTKITTGTTTLTANVSMCGTVITVSKQIIVGSPTIQGYYVAQANGSVIKSAPIMSNQLVSVSVPQSYTVQYSIELTSSLSSVSWNLYGIGNITSATNTHLYWTMPAYGSSPNNCTVVLNGTSESCPVSGIYPFQVIGLSGYGYNMIVSPNPASNNVNVQVLQTGDSSSASLVDASKVGKNLSSAPFTGNTSINHNVPTTIKFYLCNLYSNAVVKQWQVQETKAANYNLNIAGISSGTYILKMEINNKTVSTKIIVQ
jgi:hypothetical protein